ncbi:zinc finger, CCHC-type, Retrotransposon gag domain protein [Artemisia annua]|uniref:Zinc finger, CCHC-type, Retrotransposon gag domain protein n=1 Tax=Artemisia annua TaxID=35608 RepID=A0A2U1KM74_ARTAN|nr:zinc finger, CCHC-type, Retrotransposon gag domain protein [Artemisia annua]
MTSIEDNPEMNTEKRRPVNVETGGSSAERENTPEREQVSDAVKEILKGLVSGEVARALDTAMPSFVQKISDAVSQGLSGKTIGSSTVIGTSKDLENQFKYKDFAVSNPPEFHGQQDSIISYRWLLDMETAFSITKCPPENKVEYAAHLLRHRAKDWWDMNKGASSLEAVNSMGWNEFKEMFLKYFSPEAEVRKIRQDFLGMHQTTESVSEFTGYAGNEKRMMEHYLALLRKDIREFVSMRSYQKFQELTNAALEREQETQKDVPSFTRRRNDSEDVPTKRTRTESSSRPRVERDSDQKYDYPVCRICKKRHLGECRAGRNECFCCGQVGHFSRDCGKLARDCEICHGTGHDSKDCPRAKPAIQPDRHIKNAERRGSSDARAQGRAYMMPPEEVKNETGEGSGTLSICL